MADNGKVLSARVDTPFFERFVDHCKRNKIGRRDAIKQGFELLLADPDESPNPRIVNELAALNDRMARIETAVLWAMPKVLEALLRLASDKNDFEVSKYMKSVFARARQLRR